MEIKWFLRYIQFPGNRARYIKIFYFQVFSPILPYYFLKYVAFLEMGNPKDKGNIDR